MVSAKKGETFVHRDVGGLVTVPTPSTIGTPTDVRVVGSLKVTQELAVRGVLGEDDSVRRQ